MQREIHNKPITNDRLNQAERACQAASRQQYTG
jgi:hypothetical protein